MPAGTLRHALPLWLPRKDKRAWCTCPLLSRKLLDGTGNGQVGPGAGVGEGRSGRAGRSDERSIRAPRRPRRALGADLVGECPVGVPGGMVEVDEVHGRQPGIQRGHVVVDDRPLPRRGAGGLSRPGRLGDGAVRLDARSNEVLLVEDLQVPVPDHVEQKPATGLAGRTRGRQPLGVAARSRGRTPPGRSFVPRSSPSKNTRSTPPAAARP